MSREQIKLYYHYRYRNKTMLYAKNYTRMNGMHENEFDSLCIIYRGNLYFCLQLSEARSGPVVFGSARTKPRSIKVHPMPLDPHPTLLTIRPRAHRKPLFPARRSRRNRRLQSTDRAESRIPKRSTGARARIRDTMSGGRWRNHHRVLRL